MSSTCQQELELDRLKRRISELEQELAGRESSWSAQEVAHLQRLAVVGELCAEMAHEVNQPLAAIRWFAEATLNQLKDMQAKYAAEELAKLKETIELIATQAEAAQKLTGRLYGTARTSTGEQEEFAIGQVLADVLPLVKVLADRYSVAIEVDSSDDLPKLVGDRLQVGQVLLNLLRNAVEAVALGPAERRRVLVSAHADTAHVVITVRDWGEGIPADLLPRVFERFFTTRKIGTGLGLAISRDIVRRHGGRISVRPNDDFGVTFEVVLPVA